MIDGAVQADHQVLLGRMEASLAHLAMHWRGTPPPAEEQEAIRRYRAILTCMLELGLDHPLDIDSELPDELMPEAYFDRFR